MTSQAAPTLPPPTPAAGPSSSASSTTTSNINNPQQQRQKQHALRTIDEAFTNFHAAVTKDDARHFQDTKLGDVWSAAREVEQKLAAKQSARHLKRIQPFLDGLEHYSKAIEVLCNGTPYLPWIWAPIKLCLMIASDHLTAFEKLIKAYSQVSQALPRFDRLSHALKAQPEFQNVLALVYCDIIEFHHRAYRMFNFPAWKRFFDTSWKRFDLHFAAVLESLNTHTELVDKEASAYGIESIIHSAALLHDSRQRIYDLAAANAEERRDREFEAVISWLDVPTHSHEDDLARLNEKLTPGTCDWLFKHRNVHRWINVTPTSLKDAKLWVHGKPGSGKSVLSAALIQRLSKTSTHAVVYHLCSYQSGLRNDVSSFMRSVARQLLQRQPDLAGNVYDEYIRKGSSPSLSTLKPLVVGLLACLGSTRIVIDGVDECADVEQRELLKAATGLTDDPSNGGNCKIAVFSRDVDIIHRQLAKYPRVSLGEEKAAVDQAIGIFVHSEISALRQEQDDLAASGQDYIDLERQIISKADGMFLWASLVLFSLRNVYSLHDLRTIVHELPPGLDQAYCRIIERIRNDLPAEVKNKALAIFSWVAFAERPMFFYEIISAIAFSKRDQTLSEETKLTRRVLELGKPLIEIAPNGIVSFVHFTVKEFLLSQLSGPCLSIAASQRDIALACVLSVQRSLDIMDPSLPEEAYLKRILAGLLGFHNYSLNNWLSHLRLYDEHSDRPNHASDVDDDLSITLRETALWHSALMGLLGKHAPDDTLDNCSPQHLERLCTSNHYARLLRALHEESMSTQATGDTDNQAPRTSQEVEHYERTLFPSLRRKYDALLNILIAPGGHIPKTIDQSVIADFRATFGSTAFHCNFPGCNRESVGFPSARARDEHERDHRPRLLCTEKSCLYANAIGFRSAKELKRHLDKSHSRATTTLPKFKLGRTRVAGKTGTPDSILTSQSTDTHSQGLLGKSVNETISNTGLSELEDDTSRSADLRERLRREVEQRMQMQQNEFSGWQAHITFRERAASIIPIIAAIQRINRDGNRAVEIALLYEERLLSRSLNKGAYLQSIQTKFAEIAVRIRQLRTQRAAGKDDDSHPLDMADGSSEKSLSFQSLGLPPVRTGGVANQQSDRNEQTRTLPQQQQLMLRREQMTAQQRQMTAQRRPMTTQEQQQARVLQQLQQQQQIKAQNEGQKLAEDLYRRGQEQSSDLANSTAQIQAARARLKSNGHVDQESLAQAVRVYTGLTDDRKDEMRAQWLRELSERDRSILLSAGTADPLMMYLYQGTQELKLQHKMGLASGMGSDSVIDVSGVLEQQANALKMQESGEQVVPASEDIHLLHTSGAHTMESGSAGEAAHGGLELLPRQVQLQLLEQQNKKRLAIARQEQDEDATKAQGEPTVGRCDLKDWAPQLQLLEQQNKRRLLLAGQEPVGEVASEAQSDGAAQFLPLSDDEKQRRLLQRENNLRLNAQQNAVDPSQVVRNYYEQVEQLDELNQRRMAMARSQQETPRIEHDRAPRLQPYQEQLMLLEQQNKKRRLPANDLDGIRDNIGPASGGSLQPILNRFAQQGLSQLYGPPQRQDTALRTEAQTHFDAQKDNTPSTGGARARQSDAVDDAGELPDDLDFGRFLRGDYDDLGMFDFGLSEMNDEGQSSKKLEIIDLD